MSAKLLSEILIESGFGGADPKEGRAWGAIHNSVRALGGSRLSQMAEQKAKDALAAGYALCNLGFMHCESPIEKTMLGALVFADWQPFKSIPARVKAPKGPLSPDDVVICPQFNLGPYRLDFLIIARSPDGSQKWVNVECDGDEFHNRDKPTWDGDRERDKFMRGCGVDVFRFTGSDIWRDARGLAEEVVAEMTHWLRGTGNGNG